MLDLLMNALIVACVKVGEVVQTHDTLLYVVGAVAIVGLMAYDGKAARDAEKDSWA